MDLFTFQQALWGMSLWGFIFRNVVGFKSAVSLEGDSLTDISFVSEWFIHFSFSRYLNYPFLQTVSNDWLCFVVSITTIVLLSPSGCGSFQQKLIKTLNIWFCDLLDYIIYSKTKTKINAKEYFFYLTFFCKDLLFYKQIFKGYLSRSKHVFGWTCLAFISFWYISWYKITSGCLCWILY